MKYTCYNNIKQVYDRHYKFNYLSNMNIKAQGVEGGEKEIQFFAKAKSMLTAVSNFLECKNGCGDDAEFENFLLSDWSMLTRGF